MAENNTLHLCAGAFFALLYQYKRPVSSLRTGYTEEKSELTQNEISLRLTRVFLQNSFPNPKTGTLTTHVSNLINCKKEKLGSSTPYSDPSYVSALHGALKTNYPEALQSWSGFLDTVLDFSGNPAIAQTFTGRLLAAIEADPDFSGYYNYRLQQYVSKDALLSCSQVIFQTFTLNIWAWICEKAPSNIIEAAELNRWLNSHDTEDCAVVFIMAEEEIKKIAPLPAKAEKETILKEIPAAILEDRSQPVVKAIVTNAPAQQETEVRQPVDRSRYHIFIGLLDSTEPQGYFMVPKDRALKEYTDDEFIAQFLPFTKDGIQTLKQYPAVFLDELQPDYYEKGDMPAYFGFITDIKPLGTGVKIYYSIHSTFMANDIVPIMDELDLHSSCRWCPVYGELTRTHWALKDVNVYDVFRKHEISVHLPDTD